MRDPAMADELPVERLRLLASAIAAGPVDVAPGASGEPGWADGATIYLDPSAEPDEQLRTLAVQASLLAAGSLDPAIVRRLGARGGRAGELARRYLALEGRRALAANVAFLPWAVLPHVEVAGPGWPGSPTASLEAAQGRGAVGDPPAWFGELRPRQVLALAERAPAGDAAANTGRSASALPDIDLAGDDDDAPDLGSVLSSPVGGGGPIGRLLQRLLSPVRSRGGSGPPGADAATHVGGRGRAGASGAFSVRADPVAVDLAATEERGFTYAEWDVHRQRYRPDWCTVVESDPRPDELVWMAMPDGAELRRPLARLGAGLVPSRRRPQGDDIDIDAAVEATVQAAAGTAVDEQVYVESLRVRRDLSVQVLLDVSGSAAEPGPGGRPVHEHQLRAAAALVTALHDLGDRVALHAFNSQGRSSVRFVRVKDFDDGLDAKVAQRLGGLVPNAYTRLGAAIRHGAAHLDEHGGTSRRLLVVLSDGFAYDHGYEGRYGESDARRALTEARRAGIGCLCLSVGAGVDAAALRRVFGTAAHASVATTEQLPAMVGPLFRASLLAAETRRRVHQRRHRTTERLDLERRSA